MRLVRVEQLRETGAWYDGAIRRSNAPYGETSHWTRPLDVVLLAGATVLAPFLGFERALFWAGAFAAPLLHLAILLLVPWAASPLLNPEARRLAVLAVLAQPAVMSYAVAGRADHHMLLLLALVVTLGLMLRALDEPDRRRPFLLAGFVAACGLWISVEFLLAAAVALAALGALWVVRGEPWSRGNLGFAVGLTVGSMLCLAAERAPSDWLHTEYDRLSVVHVTVGALAALCWGVLARAGPRLGAASSSRTRGVLLALGAVAGAGAMRALYPRFFHGPMAGVDPRIVPLWLERVEEFQPLLLPVDLVSLGRLVAYLGVAAVVVPFVVWLLARERNAPSWAGWLYVAVGLSAFIPAAVLRVRFATYAEVLLAIALAAVLSRLLDRIGRRAVAPWRMPLRVGATAGLLVGFLGLGWGVQRAAAGRGGARAAAPARPSCALPDLARWLAAPDGLGGAPRTVLAFWDYGSELLYRTPHRVVGTPYHRNAAGILATHRVFTAREDAVARAVIARRGIDLVLVCPGGVESRLFQSPGGAPSLHRRLAEGRAPSWLETVPLEERFGAFRLYRVHR